MKERVLRGMTAALAVLAAIVATGMIAGIQMWPWICLYWCTVTAKYALEWVWGNGT